MLLVVVLLFLFLSTYSIQNQVKYCLFKCFFIPILVDSACFVVVIIIAIISFVSVNGEPRVGECNHP